MHEFSMDRSWLDEVIREAVKQVLETVMELEREEKNPHLRKKLRREVWDSKRKLEVLPQIWTTRHDKVLR